MSSLKTIILKYLLVCVFLVSPCCVHRDNSKVQSIFSDFFLAYSEYTGVKGDSHFNCIKPNQKKNRKHSAKLDYRFKLRMKLKEA